MSVALSPYQERWPREFERLASRLHAALGTAVVAIDHIGSTAVPGLPAKDVIDVQVIVRSLEPSATLLDAFRGAGFGQRPGDWNLRDHIPASWDGDTHVWAKLVVGPLMEERPSNVHVRVAGSPNERYALLFRDYLRSERSAREAWGEFKARLARAASSREEYGQIKDPATDVLMAAAEAWARERGWSVRGAA